jgi:hypothetical protein
MTNYSTLGASHRFTPKELGEFEEATGLLQRVRSSEHALILQFEWADLRIEPDPSQSESFGQTLKDCVGKNIAILRTRDNKFLVRHL